MAEQYLAYDWYATVEPRLDAPIVGFVPAGTLLHDLTQSNADGFVVLHLGQRRAYLPLAACRNTPGPHEPTMGKVQSPTSLAPTSQLDVIEAVVPATEYLELLLITQRFALVRRQNKQVVYVPVLLLEKVQPNTSFYKLKQPVRVYDLPVAGAQSGGSAIIFPQEPIHILGVDTRSMLVQRENGQVGFIRRSVMQQRSDVDHLFPIGPVDLLWIIIGMLWGAFNIVSVGWMIANGGFVPTSLQWVVLLIVIVAVAAALIGLGRKPLIARSFAIGILCAYLLIVVSQR